MGIAPPFLPEVVTRATESQRTQAGTQSDIGVHCSSKNLDHPPNLAPGKRSFGGQEQGGPAFLSWPPVGHCQLPGGRGAEALNSWGPQDMDQASSPSQYASPSSSLDCPGALWLLSHGCHGNHRWLKFA